MVGRCGWGNSTVGTGNGKSIIELFPTHFAFVFDDENFEVSDVRDSFVLLRNRIRS